MIVLREYQNQLKADIYNAWQYSPNIMAVLATGGGKTAVFSSIFYDMMARPNVAIAHRQELVSQISMALAKMGVHHRIIASEIVVKFCITQQIIELGQSYVNPTAPVAVAGVQTLIRREDKLTQWRNSVEMWCMDEAHHVCIDNQWGKATLMFPRARGLGVTATPIRTDKKPLGREFGGLFDQMITGPSMRDLIKMGYLTDYRMFAPPRSINTAEIEISKSTGDFNLNQLRKAAHKSTIVGDMVSHYQKFIPGKQAIGFLVDVEQAMETAERFRQAGIPAIGLSARSTDRQRQKELDKFRSRETKVLLNVDLFGEGFDVPFVEGVMGGRPTQSYSVYAQGFGRMMRTAPGKEYGYYIDLVNNFLIHGLPDANREWKFEPAGEKRKRDPNVIPLTACTACFMTYESVFKICPYCGHVHVPDRRDGPEFVDGDLTELSPELLAAMRGEIQRVETGNAAIPYGASDATIAYLKKRWDTRQLTLRHLQDAIDQWAGIQKYVFDRTDDQAYRAFYLTFGVDVLTGQSLKTKDMEKLLTQIRETFI